ncbi:hypothetical protein Glove_33g48 [Diversispora epigaea]|uniref:Uncharacterized protein n=1 Tax=Diversispora epigaea TaxID=1348612 RepID=A0A397JNG0_9GLOM|nr:hypothetical protein Glove_33g48 [Diversispora epigaea]
MFCLFANKKSNPKELLIKNRENNLNDNKNNCNGNDNCNDEMMMRNYELLFKKPLKSLQKIKSADEVYELLSQISPTRIIC